MFASVMWDWLLRCYLLLSFYFYTYKVYSVTDNISVQFSHSVMSDSLWPHGFQNARLPNSRSWLKLSPSSWWCHPTISSSIIPFSCLQSFPASRFSNESVLRIMWPKYWSFSLSISPSNEYSGLISFRID